MAATVIDGTNSGVVGDGVTLNTARIQKAIDDCAAAGGGTVRFPAGRYLTGTIQIKSHVGIEGGGTGMSGIALYAVDGGDLRNVKIEDVTMDGVTVPISIRLGSRLKTFRKGDEPKHTGTLRDVTVQNVTAKNVKLIGMLINGVPGHPVESLTLENIRLELPGGGDARAAKVELPEKESAYPEYNMFGKTLPAAALYARHVRGMKLENVQTTVLKPDARPTTVFVDVKDVTPANFAAESSKSK